MHFTKLRAVKHKYAVQIAAHACAVEQHARKLVRLHAKIKAEAIAIAGPDYDEQNAFCFEETASLDCAMLRPAARSLSLDVVDMASSMANRAGYVAACTVPPNSFLNNDNKIEIKQVSVCTCGEGGTKVKGYQTFHT